MRTPTGKPLVTHRTDSTEGAWALTGLTFCYFLPWAVACTRKHPQHLAIFWLTLLTGFTGIGWVAALVWALITPRTVTA